MINKEERRIIEYIDKNRNYAIKFLSDLIKIPSLTGYEKNAQLFVKQKLDEMGLETLLKEPDVEKLFKHYPEIAQNPSKWKSELDMPLKTKDIFTYEQLIKSEYNEIKDYKNRPNVIGIYRGTGSGKSLILNGHIDVVTTEPLHKWTHDPWGAEIADNKLYGRGTTDMKGGIAAMLMAFETVIESGIKLRGDVFIQSVVNEEHAGNGSLQCVMDGYTADAAIIAEPSGSNCIITETGGGIYWEIKITGRETHAGARWHGNEQYGISAIEKAPLIINNLLKMEKELNHEEPNISMCIGKITGGSYSTSTALECTLNGVAYFSADLGTGSEGMNYVKNRLKDAVNTVDDKWLKENPPTLFFQHYDDAYKFNKTKSEIKAVVEEAGTDVLGVRMIEDKLNGAADTRHLGNRGGIPVIIYGPGNCRNAHSVDEYIDLDDYMNALKVLAVAIYRWCR